MAFTLESRAYKGDDVVLLIAEVTCCARPEGGRSVTVFYALKALLRRLGVLPKNPEDDLHHAQQRHKTLMREIRRHYGLKGFQVANQATDEANVMVRQMSPTDEYPPAQITDDVTAFRRAKYLPN